MNGGPRPPRWGDEAPRVAEPFTGEDLNRLWADPPGLRGQLTGVQNDKIGARLLLTGFFFVLLGGSFDSLVMRAQLAIPVTPWSVRSCTTRCSPTTAR